MNCYRSLLTAVRAALCVVVLAITASAQLEVCLSVHAGPASGVNSNGQPSQVTSRIKVNGVDDTRTVNPVAGQTAAQVSAAQEAQYRAAGFRTRRINANKFCIIAGPGGAPITAGVSYGNDDTGLDLDSGVRRLPPGPGGPVAPGAKGRGVGIGLPPDNHPPLPLPQPVEIRIIIEVIDRNGVVRTIVVRVQLFPGMNGQQIQAMIIQALRQAGFTPSGARWNSAIEPYRLWYGLLLERSLLGEDVQHVEYQYDALARRVLPRQELFAGVLPEHGIGTFGLPTLGAAPRMPSAWGDGLPAPASFFDITYQIELPNAPGGEVIGFAPAELPIPNLGGWLYVDPGTSIFVLQLTDPMGTIRHRYVVPNDPGLVGLKLFTQGLALDAATMQLSMTEGLQIAIGN